MRTTTATDPPPEDRGQRVYYTGTTATGGNVFYNVRANSYRTSGPRPRPAGPNAVPAPEPFPDGPLRWTITRLDQQPIPPPEP